MAFRSRGKSLRLCMTGTAMLRPTLLSIIEGGGSCYVNPEKPFSSDRLVRTRYRLFPCLIFCVLALSVPPPATAEEVPKSNRKTVAGKAAVAAPNTKPRTRIEIDQDAAVIRFITDGQERAVLDADGLHVRGDIHFTGQVIDTNTWQAGGSANAP